MLMARALDKGRGGHRKGWFGDRPLHEGTKGLPDPVPGPSSHALGKEVCVDTAVCVKVSCNWLPAVLVCGPHRHVDQQGRAQSGQVWPWQRSAFISNSACHREATAAGVAPQTPPLGAPGILTGQPCLGATWGGGGGRPAASVPRRGKRAPARRKHRGHVYTSHTGARVVRSPCAGCMAVSC